MLLKLSSGSFESLYRLVANIGDLEGEGLFLSLEEIYFLLEFVVLLNVVGGSGPARHTLLLFVLDKGFEFAQLHVNGLNLRDINFVEFHHRLQGFVNDREVVHETQLSVGATVLESAASARGQQQLRLKHGFVDQVLFYVGNSFLDGDYEFLVSAAVDAHRGLDEV